MSKAHRRALGLLLFAGSIHAASVPVAMRVELEPVRQAGDRTAVVVVIQVSPEDRARIGSNAIVRIELDGGAVSSGSPMRAVRLEDDGSTRFTVEWPPGEHHLQVEIEDPAREDTGLWVGTVRVPDLSPAPASQPPDQPTPVPVPVPVPVPESPAPGEIPSQQPDAAEEPVQEVAPEAPVAVDAATAAPPAMDQSTPAPESREIETLEVVPVPVPDSSEPADVAMTETNAANAAEPEAAARETIAVEPPSVEAPPVETNPPLEAEAMVEEAAPEAARDVTAEEMAEPEARPEEESLVEPLRAEPPEEGEPPAAAPSPAEELAAAGVPAPADLVARYEAWGSGDSESSEFSVIMLRGREPATNIAAADVRIRVAGSDLPVEKIGDLNSAPLLLGLAVDVVQDEVGDRPGMEGSLAPIMERAADGRGRLFVADRTGVGEWSAEAALPEPSREPMDLTELVVASLERFEGLRGRTFLVVLTDGRREPSKEAWQRATDVAGTAGVPILVVVLWDEGFSGRTRKNLKKLTDVSGGSLFLVQGRAQLESASDRFGRYLDGGYAIRFKPPADAAGAAVEISVSVTDRSVSVSAPKAIR